MAKRLAWLIIGVLTALTARPAAATEELRILASARLTPPAVVERFEKEFGLRVRFEYFESPEDLAAYIEAQPRDDLALIRGYYVENLARSGRVIALDHALLPNLRNLSRGALENPTDPGCQYSVPYLQGTLGILYRAGLWGTWPPSWENIFGQGAGVAPFAVINQYRDVLGIALRYLGHSGNATSPAAVSRAAGLLRGLSAHPAFLGYLDPDTIQKYFKEKFIYAAVTYNNLAAAAIAVDPGLAYHVPRGGGLAWTYAYVINSQSPRQAAAHAWLNYLLRPEVAAEISVWNLATSPNQAALDLLPPAVRNNAALYPSEAVWENAEYLQSVGEAESVYLEDWSRLQ